MKKITLSILLLAYFLMSGCANNPATGKKDIVLMSEKKEISIGKNMHKKMMKEGSAYENKYLQKYVSTIGENLQRNSHRNELAYKFTVLNSPDINAFALPGGYIYINRGLLAYLKDETQLAAVLAHEIGHVTARHAVRQQTAAAASRLLAAIAYIGTGSSDLAEASNMAGTAMVKGYGREHELEADRLGAEYLYNSGYNPDALIEVIGILKDQERYSKLRAKRQGKTVQSYHGLFSTHPRNDRRLKEVVNKARSLGSSPIENIDSEKFREKLDKLAFGKLTKGPRRLGNHFYHNKLRFTFRYPKGWSVKATSKAITATNIDRQASMKLRIRRSDKNINPREYLSQYASINRLFQSQSLQQFGLKGHTGLTPPSPEKNAERIAVIYYGPYAYVFTGSVKENLENKKFDNQFLELIESFRPLKRSEYSSSKPDLSIEFIQADKNTNFSKLASESKLVRDAETQLRLLNGYYSGGEPKIGEWVKVVN